MSIQGQIDRIKGAVAGAYSSISDMGGTLPAQQISAHLAEAIRSIPTRSALGTPLDPALVYESTRPADWLPMPTPQDNEMYLLFQIPDGASSLLAFTVTCTGSYTVALGTVSSGQFVQQSARSVASGGKYEAELLAANFGNLTSDGMKQVMVKVSGTGILTWEPSTHSKKTAPANFAGWNIVEISCRLPQGTKAACGNSTSNLALKKLRYFSWAGTNNVTGMGGMFYNCYGLLAILHLSAAKAAGMSGMFRNCLSLMALPALDAAAATSMNSMFYGCYGLAAIPELNTAKVTDMNSMFRNCYSLTTVPQLNTAKVTDMSSMFYGCLSLTALPELNTAGVTGMGSMFYNCYSLTAIPQLNTAKVTNMSSMFYNCYSLKALPELNTALVTNMNSMFYGCYGLTVVPKLNTAKATDMGDIFRSCYSIERIQLDPSVTGWAGCAISLSNCSLGHQALVDFLQSLPTITAAKSVTLIGAPGVSELTAAEKAIAGGKSWSLLV